MSILTSNRCILVASPTSNRSLALLSPVIPRTNTQWLLWILLALVGAAAGHGGCGLEGTAEVGGHPTDRTWSGALDLGGNVREWVDTDYAAYPGGTANSGLEGKVNRGGSWAMTHDQLSDARTRLADDPGEQRPDLGVRCAVGLD